MCLDRAYFQIRIALDVTATGTTIITESAIVKYIWLARGEFNGFFHTTIFQEVILYTVVTEDSILYISL